MKIKMSVAFFKKHLWLIGAAGVLLGTALLMALEVLYLKNAILNGKGVQSTAKWQMALLAVAVLFSARAWLHWRESALWSAAALALLMLTTSVFSAMYDPAEGLGTLVKLFLWLFVFLLGYVGTRHYRADLPMIWLGCATLLLLAFLFSREIYTSFATPNKDYVRTYIYFLICCAPFAFSLRSKVLTFSLLAVVSVCVLASMKRSALLVWGITLLLLVTINFRPFVKKAKAKDVVFVGVAIMAAAAVALFYLHYRFGGIQGAKEMFGVWMDRFAYGNTDRVVLRRETWQAFWKSDFLHQLFGHGQNAVTQVTTKHFSAHNDFLEVLYDHGLLALGAYLTFLVSLGISAVRLFRQDRRTANGLICALSILCVASIPSHLLTYGTYFLLLAFYLGYAQGRAARAGTALLPSIGEIRGKTV